MLTDEDLKRRAAASVASVDFWEGKVIENIACLDQLERLPPLPEVVAEMDRYLAELQQLSNRWDLEEKELKKLSKIIEQRKKKI